MAVSVGTLWLIYVLAILVFVIVLCMSTLKVHDLGLFAAFAGSVAAILIISFVPVDVITEQDKMLYDLLFFIGYVLPIVLITVLAASAMKKKSMWEGYNHEKNNHHKEMNDCGCDDEELSVKAKVTCDQEEDGSLDCHLDRVTRSKGDNKLTVSYRR